MGNKFKLWNSGLTCLTASARPTYLQSQLSQAFCPASLTSKPLSKNPSTSSRCPTASVFRVPTQTQTLKTPVHLALQSTGPTLGTPVSAGSSNSTLTGTSRKILLPSLTRPLKLSSTQPSTHTPSSMATSSGSLPRCGLSKFLLTFSLFTRTCLKPSSGNPSLCLSGGTLPLLRVVVAAVSISQPSLLLLKSTWLSAGPHANGAPTTS